MAYKYKRKDFEKFPATLRHMDMSINFLQDYVEVENVLEIVALEDNDLIALDAEELEILKVEIGGRPADYTYENDKLVIRQPLAKGSSIKAKTVTRCVPSDKHLEGIYKDTTPKGAPQQYMSQCEMWGFRRIAPAIDDPRAKCTMTTTIEADARYTHIISNGDICKKTCPDNKPVVKGGRKIIKYINDIPMSPYLFIAAAGTWDELVDHVEYDSGRKVRLEYLVPPGKTEFVRIPMEILKKSIMWIKDRHDYEYTREVYRTITMNKSDAGGMENVGNTTIVTDAALIDEHTLDGYLLYAYAVIVHEFEHNQCGSETTMETPFDMWLNEAYTVEVEREFTAGQFDAGFMRLGKVDSIRDPLLGPLAVEDAGYHGQIRREGFNDPRELIDGVTYVKAAEVIRMLRLIMGEKEFKKAKTLYFSRFKDKNANTDQFFECFEEVHGESLRQFKHSWLLRAGYPKVQADTESKNGKFTITLSQDSDFHIPIVIGLVDGKGNDIVEKTIQLRDKKHSVEFEAEPAFASISRDYSFYGTLKTDLTREQLQMQARLDPNHFNRVEAMRQLTDIERIKLIKNPEAEIDSGWLELFGRLLDDDSISPGLKSRLLTIPEQPLDRKYAAWFLELTAARDRLVESLNSKYYDRLVDAFNAVDTYTNERLEAGIEKRSLKAALLGLIAADDSPKTWELIIRHYMKATTATDRVTSLVQLNRSSSPQRRGILDEVFDKWKDNLNGYANYLRIVSSGKHNRVFEEMAEEKKKPEFDIKQPSYSRALIFPMAFNSKMLWTDEGMEWARGTILEFTEINNNLAARLLNVFQHVKMMRPPLKGKVAGHLEYILGRLTEEGNPVLYNQAKAYLGK